MPNNTLALPFTIGQTLWLPVQTPQRVTIACPVCAGKRTLTVILGNDEHVAIPCDACGLGYNGPRGVVEEWEYTPGAEAFVIAEIESFRDGEWYLRSTEGVSGYLHEMFPTEAEALEKSKERVKIQFESAMESRQRRKKSEAKRSGWTVRYHREQIRDLQRQLAWHEGKVTKVPSPPQEEK